jgi:hypothetical protein
MIFHASADRLYYDNFYQMFFTQIKKHYPNPTCSFNYVGLDHHDLDFSAVDISTVDAIDESSIREVYNVNPNEAKGYYALSRWLSIPVTGDNVVVCDIDILAINDIDYNLINQLLDETPVINITRIKPNGKEGGMMVMILRADICQLVKNLAHNLLTTENLCWQTDTLIHGFLYQNFKVRHILNMHSVQKDKSIENINHWFVFTKGGPKKVEILKDIYQSRLN